MPLYGGKLDILSHIFIYIINNLSNRKTEETTFSFLNFDLKIIIKILPSCTLNFPPRPNPAANFLAPGKYIKCLNFKPI